MAVRIGVSGASPGLMAAAEQASQLPHGVTVVAMPSQAAVKSAVADGTLDGGVAVLPGQMHLSSLLVPIVDPGASHTPGFDVVTRGTSQLGQEYAESVAAGISSVLYAHKVPHGVTADPATVAITTQNVGHSGKVNLNFFAPNIAVVFLFIGSGLGMRSLLMERSAGTLARITAAPLRPTQIVLGKLLAIFVTGLATIFVIWAVTTFAFGADWGDPLGVLLMCVGATVAMCGIGVFLTSLAKTEQQAVRHHDAGRTVPRSARRELAPFGLAPRRLPGAGAGHAERVGAGRVSAGSTSWVSRRAASSARSSCWWPSPS